MRPFCLALIGLIALPASAQLSQLDMSDREIRDFLADNTIGAHDWGEESISLEYHSPAGEAHSNEDGENTRGLYREKNGRVCYTYEGPELGDWYCWTFKRDRRTSEVYQWGPFGNAYRLFIYAQGDVVSPALEDGQANAGVEVAT